MNNEDTISRAALLDKFTDLKSKAPTLQDCIYLDGVMAVIDAAPSVPPQVVHGHILDNGNPICGPCSVCGKSANRKAHFCSECGAILDGGEDDEMR